MAGPTSRACVWKLSMADSPGNRSTTTAPSTSSWLVANSLSLAVPTAPGDIPAHWRNPKADPARLVDPGDSAIGRMAPALRRMDNVGIVVESLDAAISFFAELGLELEGRAMIEGDWSGRVTGLRDQRVETAMMRMPDAIRPDRTRDFLSRRPSSPITGTRR